MDPTLAAIVTVLAVLAASGVVAHARRTLERSSERHRAMALERGLTGPEIRELEQLARMVSDTTLASLLISPIRFSRCVQRELARLRAEGTPEARYYDRVESLTRLRRRIHPPGKLLRFLYSTRELPEGEDVSVYMTGRAGDRAQARRGVVWVVNEDFFEIRLLDTLSTRGFDPGARAELELNRAGEGRYTLAATIRKVQDEPRPVLRLEHTDRVNVDNRREHLREPHESTIFVRPSRTEGESEPQQARLQDVSGGGLSFVLPRPLPLDSEIEITLMLHDVDVPPLRMHARILRSSEHGAGSWHHTGTWIDLPDETRESLIRYVFNLHRARIREAKSA